MSAAAVGLSRNSQTGAGGFRPCTIAVNGKAHGSVKQGERAGAPAGLRLHPLRPAAAFHQTQPGVNRPAGRRERARGRRGADRRQAAQCP
jgi:hypothetical protein